MDEEFSNLRSVILNNFKNTIKELYLEFMSIYSSAFFINDLNNKILIEVTNFKNRYNQKSIIEDFDSKKVTVFAKIGNGNNLKFTFSNVTSFAMKKNLLNSVLNNLRYNIPQLVCAKLANSNMLLQYDHIIEEVILDSSSRYQKQYKMVASKIIDCFKTWRVKTYEGDKVEFCVGILKNCPNEEIENHLEGITRFFGEKYCATFSSPSQSMIVLNGNGTFKDYISVNNLKLNNADDYCIPTFCKNILLSCINTRDIYACFLILNKHGDILVFDGEGKLNGILRNDKWQIICLDAIAYQWLSFKYKLNDDSCVPDKYHDKKDTLKFISLLLDASFTYKGAILAILDDIENCLKDLDISKSTLINKAKSKNISTISPAKIVNAVTYSNRRSLLNINNQCLCEMLSMDGAMLVSKSNLKLISIGCILNQVHSANNGGGRTAATIALSNYGLSIKISEDGGITFYKAGNKVYEIY